MNAINSQSKSMKVSDFGKDAPVNPLVDAKARILTSGIDVDFEMLKKIEDYKKEDFTYDSAHHLGKTEKHLVPQEILISDSKGHTSAVSCINYNNSKYLLTSKDGELVIVDKATGEPLQVKVELPKQPEFRNMKTIDGLPVNRIISNCGLCELNVWLWHDCAFYTKRKACKFCGINAIANQFKNQDLLRISDIIGMSDAVFDSWWNQKKDFVIRNTVDALAKALKYSFSGHKHIIFTAGSSVSTDLQWKIYNDVVKAIDEQVAQLSKLDVTIILTPPKDLRLLEPVAAFGLKYAFNMEVFDPVIFERINPGKAEYVGRTHYFEAYKRAVELAGEGRVWGGFILGLEPFESLLNGVRQLGEMGVASGANILHLDEGNTLPNEIKPPTYEDTIKFFHEYGELARNNGLRPFFCEKAMRTSLNHEAFMGLI